MVLRYAYKFPNGNEKDRPALVVLAVAPDATEQQPRVMLVAISHTPPGQGEMAIEIPLPLKNKLGLDHERSFVKLNGINDCTWDNFFYDIRPVAPGKWAYGTMPQRMMDKIYQGLNEARLHEIVSRDEPPRSDQEITQDIATLLKRTI